MGLGSAFRGATEAAIAAGEGRSGQGGDLLALLVGPDRLVDDHRPLALALVVGADGAAFGSEGPAGRQGLVELDLLLAVDDHQEVDLAGPVAGGHFRGRTRCPAQGRRQDGCGGRYDLQPLLVDEGQLGLVHGVLTQADAEGVEHHVLVAIGKCPWGGTLLKDVRIKDGHEIVSSPWAGAPPVLMARLKRLRPAGASFRGADLPPILQSVRSGDLRSRGPAPAAS